VAVSGIFWSIIVFGAVGFFIVVSVYRIVTLARLPVHLRWELAPVPRSTPARAGYMAKEILLLRGVWRHNRGLWPFSMSLHAGIYLLCLVALLVIIDAGMLLWGASAGVRGTFEGVVSWLAIAAYLLGGFGALSLVVKRFLDADLKLFNTTASFFNLALLAAVFISGAYGWFTGRAFIQDLGLFTRGLVTPAGAAPPALPIVLHLSLFLVFFVYLPFSNMFHFAAKFFTYHEVRWDDRPKVTGSRLERQVMENLNRPVSWSAPHVGAGKSWAEAASGKKDDGEKA
jgi:nitrate reductase gamma subunit